MIDDLFGRWVKFCPASFCVHGYIDENAPMAVGEVVTVNEPHHTFTVSTGLAGATIWRRSMCRSSETR